MQELHDQVCVEECQLLPRFEDLIRLTHSRPNMLLNIEFRWPWEEQAVETYDYRWAAKAVIDLVDQYKIGYKVKVSCFSPVPLEGFLLESKPESNFLVHSLRNRRGRDVYNYETFVGQWGVTMLTNQLTEERVEKIHDDGMMSGVWCKPGTFDYESFELWEAVFTYDGGITYFFSDYSEQAIIVRDYY